MFLCPIQAWMVRGIVAGIGKDSCVHRRQVLPARTDRDRPWPPCCEPADVPARTRLPFLRSLANFLAPDSPDAHGCTRGTLDGFIGLGIVRGVIPSSSLGPFASPSGGGREKRPSLHIHEGTAQDLMALEELGLRYQSIGAPSAQMACSQSGAAVRLGQRGRRRRKRPEDSYNKRPAERVVTSRTVDNGYRPSLHFF
jgi:hypothetical protein